MSATSAAVVSLFESLPEDGQQFVLFWYRYPRKVCKLEAQRAWSRLSPADRAACLERLPAHVAQWQLSGTPRRFVPHAATFLHQRRWEDEIEDLDAPLADLGQCMWNLNGKREPGRPRCDAMAIATDERGIVYCAAHARKLGLPEGRR